MSVMPEKYLARMIADMKLGYEFSIPETSVIVDKRGNSFVSAGVMIYEKDELKIKAKIVKGGIELDLTNFNGRFWVGKGIIYPDAIPVVNIITNED